jgi:hypothetical protein
MRLRGLKGHCEPGMMVYEISSDEKKTVAHGDHGGNEN